MPHPEPCARAGGHPPRLSPGDALFVDFDGTLVELAPTPTDIRVSEKLPGLLTGLAARLGGAVALVSGRSLAVAGGRMRDASSGLAEMQVPSGTLIGPVTGTKVSLPGSLISTVPVTGARFVDWSSTGGGTLACRPAITALGPLAAVVEPPAFCAVT